jgi:CRP-like cAMP-binding protein
MDTALADILDVLNETDLFDDLTEDELAKVAALCEREFYPAGTVISRQGEPIGKLYVVIKGLVQFHLQVGPDRFWAVDSSPKGSCFGWATLLGPPYTWASEARCTEPTHLMVIDGSGLRALCQSHSHIGFVVMLGIGRVVTKRLENSRQQVATLADQRH